MHINLYIAAVTIFSFMIARRPVHSLKEGKVNPVLLVFSLFGGGLGVLAAIIWEIHRINKENALMAVFSISFFLIDLILAAFYTEGYGPLALHYNVLPYLIEHTGLVLYLAVINLITLFLFWIDKTKSKGQGKRIPIAALLFFCLIGGSIGGLIGIFGLRHKTKKNYFTLGVPVMLVMQYCVLLYLNTVAINGSIFA